MEENENGEKVVVEEVKVPEKKAESKPEWLDSLQSSIDRLATVVEGITQPPTPATEKEEGENPPEHLPKDGEFIRDESPERKPWTHRPLFGG